MYLYIYIYIYADRQTETQIKFDKTQLDSTTHMSRRVPMAMPPANLAQVRSETTNISTHIYVYTHTSIHVYAYDTYVTQDAHGSAHRQSRADDG